MRKAIAVFGTVFLLCFHLSAQNTFSTDTSFNTKMNLAFAPLDKTKVPFGILQDFAMEFTNVAAYNGTVLVDSTKNSSSTVMDIYNTLASGAISANAGSMVHPLFFDSLWQTQRQAGIITLAGLFFQYASFLSNAYTSNLITITNNQIYDKFVNGVWQNPYQQNKVFAVSPSVNSYNSYGTYSVKAVLPANTWLTNSSSLISSMSADFADGQGFRALATNQTFNLAYSSGGTKTWTFKLTLTNGTVLQSRTDIQLDSASVLVFSKTKSSGAARVNRLRKVNYKSFFGYPTAAQPVIADDAFYGQKAAGYMTVIYANADGKFHKPLIVAEGFDPDDILKPEEQFGGNNIHTFLKTLESSNASSNLDGLLEGNYDIIYVDWAHSEDFIERNAMLLEKVIKNVNANRATTTPIVVLGQSMGGVVARYALRDMEIKGINHQTGTFISWDGPQQGANVPIAYQYLSRQARSLYISSAIPALFGFYDNIIRPAANGFVRTVNLAKSLYGGSPWSTQWLNIRIGDIASGAVNLQDFPSPREMLINYLSTGLTIDNSIHTSWQTSLKQMGYPLGFTGQPIQKMAISNGSECAATESFLPGQVMLDIRGNANTYLIGEAFASVALPTAGLLLNQPSSLLAVLPGGNQLSVRFCAMPRQMVFQHSSM